MLATITEVLTQSNNERKITSSYHKLQKRRDRKQKKKERKKKLRQQPIPLSDYSSSDDNDLSYSDIDPTSPQEPRTMINDSNQSPISPEHCRTLEQDYTPQSPTTNDSTPDTKSPTKALPYMNEEKSQSLSSSTTVATSKTELTELSTLTNDDGWKTISSSKSTASTINHLQCAKSPKQPSNHIYNKDSPNYNKYDPEGTIMRRSNRIHKKLSQDEQNKDHPSSRTRSSKKGGRKE
jgi:hypothetical protein